MQYSGFFGYTEMQQIIYQSFGIRVYHEGVLQWNTIAELGIVNTQQLFEHYHQYLCEVT